MLEKEQELLELLKVAPISKNDLAGGNKRRLRNIVKNCEEYNLEDKQIENMWKTDGLKWDMARRVKLPKNIIDDVIEKLEVDDRVWKEFLLNQKLSDDQLKKTLKLLYSIEDFTTNRFGLIALSTLTEEMNNIRSIVDIAKDLKDIDIVEKRKGELYSEIMKICRNAKEFLSEDDFIEFFYHILDTPVLMVYEILDGVATLKFGDKTLRMIKNHSSVVDARWEMFITKVIKRNGCSKKFKTKYLLTK